MKVYYLDDEVALCNIFKEFLSSADTDVHTFVEAQPFIDQCNLTPPDLVVIDYRLAETSGDKVAATLDRGIPKILVTGELDLPDSDLFIEVVSKPYKLKNMKEIIQSARRRT